MSLEKNSITLAFEEKTEVNLAEIIDEKMSEVEREDISSKLKEGLSEPEDFDESLKEERDHLEGLMTSLMSGVEQIKVDNTDILVTPYAVKIEGGSLEEKAKEIEEIVGTEGIEFSKTAEYVRELKGSELISFLEERFGEFSSNFIVGDEEESVSVTINNEGIEIEGEKELVEGDNNGYQ